MTRSDVGTLIELRSGSLRAQVATVGAALASLTLDGHDLILPYPAKGVPTGYRGKTLIPWPNRVIASRYQVEDSTYHLDCNEPETGCALHGLMAWVDWQVIRAEGNSVTLGAFVAPRYSYPWALDSQVTFALQEETGLSVKIASTNLSDTPAPYGCAQHPYLTWDQHPTDSYELTAPGAQVVTVNEHLEPTGLVPVANADLDYRLPRLIGAHTIDHAFTAMPTPWALTLHHPQSGATVTLTSDAAWYQIYTADQIGRTGLAVEPMSCAPDAFNSGLGLIRLQPGETHTLTYSIHAELPSRGCVYQDR